MKHTQVFLKVSNDRTPQLEKIWKEEANQRIWKWVMDFTNNLINTTEFEKVQEELKRIQDALTRTEIRLEETLKVVAIKEREKMEMETKLTTIEEKLADRDTEYTHLMTLHENCEKKMIENENLQHKYTEMEIQLVQLQTTYNDTQDELKQAEEEFKTNLHQMKQEMIAAIREAKEMKQKAQNQLIQVRSTLENEIQGQKRIVETHVLKITQQEDHINQLRQKCLKKHKLFLVNNVKILKKNYLFFINYNRVKVNWNHMNNDLWIVNVNYLWNSNNDQQIN